MSRIATGSYRLFAAGSRPAAFPLVSTSADLVSEPTPQYKVMAGKWELINDLLGGTDSMRAKGERWLPREEIETMKAYRMRLAYSFLFGAFADTIAKLRAKPFSREVAVKSGADGVEPSERMRQVIENADGAGTSLTGVCSRVFELAAAYGVAHVLADVSATRPTQTAAEDAQNRPVLLPIDPRNVIGWASVRTGGSERLTMVRIAEDHWESSGRFGQKLVRYVRVIYAPGVGQVQPPAQPAAASPATTPTEPAVAQGPTGTWELYRVGADGKQQDLVNNGTHSFDGVPLFTVYFKRTEFMQAEPPLLGLAELCLNHWQSSSHQNFALRVGRFSMLKMTGVSQEELEKPVAVGPAFTFRSVNPSAEFGMVESSGAPLKSGLEDLVRLEQRMEQLGLQPLVQTTADSTAAGKQIDEGKTETTIQTWVRGVETCVSAALTAAAVWAGESLPPEGLRVDIFSEFGIASSAKDDAATLLSTHAAGALTTRTLLAELQRRSIISPDVNVEDEASEAETKAAAALEAQMNADVGGGFGAKPDDGAKKDDAEDPVTE